MSGSGLEALPDVREWSGGPPECPGVVGRPFRMSRSGREALPMSRSDQEALPDGRDALPKSESGPDTLSDVRERSGVNPGCRGVVGRPSKMFKSGREALPNVQE